MTSWGVPPVPPASQVPLVNAPVGMAFPVTGLSPIGMWAQLGGLVFGCYDALGILWHFNDIEGWMDGTSVATAKQQRSAQHGSWMGTTWLEERDIVFSGHVEAPTPVLAWQARNVLLGVLAALSSDGTMDVDTPLVVNEPDAVKAGGVRVSDKPTVTAVDGRVFSFSVPMTMRDPRKYGVGKSVSIGLPVASGGLTFPVTFPVTFGAGSGGVVTCANDGNFVASPTVTFFGSVSNPGVYQSSTGFSLQFGITLASGDILVINTDLLTATLNGTTSRLNTLVAGSQFPYLMPGVSSLQFTAASYDATARMGVSWSSVWW